MVPFILTIILVNGEDSSGSLASRLCIVDTQVIIIQASSFFFKEILRDSFEAFTSLWLHLVAVTVALAGMLRRFLEAVEVVVEAPASEFGEGTRTVVVSWGIDFCSFQIFFLEALPLSLLKTFFGLKEALLVADECCWSSLCTGLRPSAHFFSPFLVEAASVEDLCMFIDEVMESGD